MIDQKEAIRRICLSLDRLQRLIAIDPPAPAVIVENERRILARRVDAFPCAPEIKECVDQMEANIARGRRRRTTRWRSPRMSYPYAEHDNGVVLTQPRPGEFERRPMTAGELAAREPALKIAKDIYRHANQAGVCYYEFWRLIADAIDACARPEALCSGWIACAERLPELGAQVLIWPYAKSGNKYDSPVGYYDEYGVLKKDRRREFKCFGEFIKVTHWQPLPSFPSPLRRSQEKSDG